MKLLIHIFMIAVLFMGLTGCGLKSRDENSHPLFKRAVKAQKSNELKVAIDYFNRYLALRPDSSVTHLRLASIYDENLDQPLRAVYHYERFLEFAPNSPEAGDVKKWRDAAFKKYYFKIRQKLNDPEDVGVLQNTLYLTEQELKKNKLELKKIKSIQKKLIQYARETKNNEKILKTSLSSLQAVHQRTLDEMKKLSEELKEKSAPKENKKEEKEAETVSKDKPEEIKTTEKVKTKEEKKIIKPEVKKESKSLPIIPKAVVTAPPFITKKADNLEVKPEITEIKTDNPKVKINAEERTYTVEKGDSLSSISRKMYGSAKYYKRIFEVNRETIPSEKALRPGQVLKIPRL